MASLFEHLLAHEAAALEQVLVEICDELDPFEPLGADLQDLLRDLVGRAAARRAVGQTPQPRRGRVVDQSRRIVSIPGVPE